MDTTWAPGKNKRLAKIANPLKLPYVPNGICISVAGVKECLLTASTLIHTDSYRVISSLILKGFSEKGRLYHFILSNRNLDTE